MSEDRNVVDRLNLELIRQGGLERVTGLSALYRARSADLKIFLRYRYKANAQDIEDIVQETFIKIVQNCENYRGDASLWTWMRRIARNCCIDHFREANNRPAENFDDDEWFTLEKSSPALQVTVTNLSFSGDNLEDCFSKGFSAFAEKEPERAYALSLVVNEFDMINISNFLNRTEDATREYLSQCRKKIKKFLEPCREYLSPS